MNAKTSLEKAEKLRIAIEEYLALHRGAKKNWEFQSCHNVPHPDLTAFLYNEKLISSKDIVYLAGKAGMLDEEKKRGFQIGIGEFSPDAHISRQNAWFIWNAYGYDPRAENSGFIRDERRNTYHFSDREKCCTHELFDYSKKPSRYNSCNYSDKE